MVDFNRKVYALLGLVFDAVNQQEAVTRLETARAGGARCFLSTPNLNFLVASQHDAVFRDSVYRSDLSVADGMPLVWMSRLLGLPLRERVSGSGLFETLRHRAQQPWKVFFFGGNTGVGQEACLSIGDTAAMRAVGWLSPGFGSLASMSREDVIDCINQSQADFLVVSLGAAKGQDWISQNLHRLNTPVVSHLGAVVNFAAGTVQRAPRWIQRTGFEWLWRIKEEPHLWRRYASDSAVLARLLLTRVLPLALWQRIGAPSAHALAQAQVRPLPQSGLVGVQLTGAWQAANLAPVRQAFAELYAQASEVTLDMSTCTSVDSAFCGLLMLLDMALRDRGQSLRLTGLEPRVARLLRLHGVAW